MAPADREHLRAWLGRFTGCEDVHFALEGCTGWRYAVEELLAAGITPHLAEPADTAARRTPRPWLLHRDPGPARCGWANLPMARKLARRCYDSARTREDALAPAA